ncbi:substrate-binding periplasmic protein [Porticoccus sp.]
MKRFLTICALFCLALSVEARTLDDIAESGYISIAVYRDFPPYSYMNEGAPAGIDIELGAKIAQRLGYKPRWFWLTADESVDDDLRNAVWKGHYLGGGVADIMLRVPYDKDYINDQVSVVGPYQKERWTVARNAGNLPDLVNLAPFMYHKVGVEIDSVPDLKLTSAFGGRLVDNVIHYSSTIEAVDALKSQEIDAVAGMRGQIEWRVGPSVAASGQSAQITISDESLVAWSRRAWDIAIAVKNTNQALGQQVEAAITSMTVDGEIEEIFQKYQVSYEAVNQPTL